MNLSEDRVSERSIRSWVDKLLRFVIQILNRRTILLLALLFIAG